MDEGTQLILGLLGWTLAAAIAITLLIIAIKATIAIINSGKYLAGILSILQRQEKRELQDRANRKLMQ